ncbi:MAG: rod shape-determining protein MreC, partial [Candidatus Omnitrophica bacterium]|nr:rod shape-determining protein MreC [Candidatus Omnitrophota bacterium]
MGNFWKTFRNQKHLETRLAELESKVVLVGELERENERLKKLLAFKDSVSGKKIAARVISWDSSPWRKTILLDKGTQDGLKKDMVVIVPEGVVGRILETGPLTARVILLSDPDARVGAITEQSRAQGVLAGNGSGKLHMQYLTLESGVMVEETVLTSGISGIFPKGLRLGAVESISR